MSLSTPTIHRINATLVTLLLGAALPSSQADADSWVETGRLVQPRNSHTATVLLSGKVLITGGRLTTNLTGTEALASTELYDPETGSWTLAAPLSEARWHHTATLLPSGRVLIVGGVDSTHTLASAELYDPTANIWTPVGSLAARNSHTATLLSSGKVLVAGGLDGEEELSSAELFDPDTGIWTSAGSIKPRSHHTATLLRSGRVLVAAGGRSIPLSSAELYDPTTNSWAPAKSLTQPRSYHTATLLPSGQVLVAAGGRGAPSAELYDPDTNIWTETVFRPNIFRSLHTAALLPSGQVLVVGGAGFFTSLSSAELYEPETDSWTTTGSLTSLRQEHTISLLPSGQVLVAGGLVQGEMSLPPPPRGEVFEQAALTWTPQNALSQPRRNHTATLLPTGQVLVVGGEDDDGAIEAAELFDPEDGEWTAVGSLINPRWAHTATLLPGGQVVVAGGNDDGAISTVELFDPEGESFFSWGSLAESRYFHTATRLPSGHILIAGGRGSEGSPLSTVELLDPTTGNRTTTSSMSEPRVGHTATLLPMGRVLVAGGSGETGALLSTAELYTPATGSWTLVGSLVERRAGHTATLLPAGRVLVVGGAGGTFLLSSAEVFDPLTESWSLVGSIAGARGSHTATLLLSGQVLVAGGRGNILNLFVSTAEIYNPLTGQWTPRAAIGDGRVGHTATLTLDGQVLIAGGSGEGFTPLDSATLLDPDFDVSRRPVITAIDHSIPGQASNSGASLKIGHTSPFEIAGTGFGGDSEASGGSTNSSAATTPFVHLRALEGEAQGWLSLADTPVFCPANPDADSPLGFCADQEATLKITGLPPVFHPGPHLLTVFAGGVPSEPQRVDFECSLAVSGPLGPNVPRPQVLRAAIGEQATFGPVSTRGVRSLQWQLCQGDPTTVCADADEPGTTDVVEDSGWIDIQGATAATYTTPPIAGPESGTLYRVIADSGCTQQASTTATLSVIDDHDPLIEIQTPDGGELWLLSATDAAPNVEPITWDMSDDIRICRVEVSLLVSTDGGISFVEAAEPSGGLPVSYGPGDSCVAPGEATSSTTYQVPTDFSLLGGSGSLYKIRVEVTDHSGRTAADESLRPFFIVRPNPDSVKTLILTNLERMRRRMGVTPDEANQLELKLHELAAHPRVQGRVIDLDDVTSLSELYDAWDAGTGAANEVLFAAGGLHEHLRGQLEAFSGVEYLVLVGDDRIIPLARMPDRTAILSESSYPEGDEITATGTTVGRALADNQYLSDDPLATRDPLHPTDLPSNLFVPDLAIGRLVENPDEIITTIATFFSQDGVLDLSLHANKAQVTGYDFLIDSGNVIAERWRNLLGAGPVDGELLSTDWGETSVAARRTALAENLCGAGDPYAVLSLNGHATHYEEGVPGTDPFDIQGLATADLDADVCSGEALDLAGRVVYAVGCHGGLPVPGSDPADADHSLDLPQTMMRRGAVSYVANTGYGWGLLQGIGYGERLVQLMTEELTAGGTIAVGKAVGNAKLRYFLETPRFDVYDEKSLMQWTVFGLPMYALSTGASRAPAGTFAGPAPTIAELPVRETVGDITVNREVAGATRAPLPAYLLRLDLHFDFTAPGVYTKRNHRGEIQPDIPGCADPEGCYYTLNGVFERGSGESDLPIQPTFTFDSRLRGTSQHGVLWKGGAYDQESGWVPVVGELASNGGDFSAHGSTPRIRRSRPTAPRLVPGEDPPGCRPSDLEVNSLVIEAGEVLKERDTDPEHNIQRLYREIDLEVLYFNNTADATGNCDRVGPQLGDGPFHAFDGSAVSWTVSARDDIGGAAGVWRVLVVWSDGSLDASGVGRWSPLELEVDGDGDGIWRGSLPADDRERLTYVVQAVDRRGNVTWLDFTADEMPNSGIDPGIPLPVDVELVLPEPSTIFSDGFETADTSRWAR